MVMGMRTRTRTGAAQQARCISERVTDAATTAARDSVRQALSHSLIHWSVDSRLTTHLHRPATALFPLSCRSHRMPDEEDDDMDEGASVEAILRAFNAPINEEQCWALCFQTVRHLTSPVPACLTPKDLVVGRDGTVRILSAPTGTSSSLSRHSLTLLAAHDASEKDFLMSLGRLLYSALDYGLMESEERVLDPELEALIVKLTTKEDEGSCDEGIENDEDESAPPIQQPLTRSSVLQVSKCPTPTCVLILLLQADLLHAFAAEDTAGSALQSGVPGAVCGVRGAVRVPDTGEQGDERAEESVPGASAVLCGEGAADCGPGT